MARRTYVHVGERDKLRAEPERDGLGVVAALILGYDRPGPVSNTHSSPTWSARVATEPVALELRPPPPAPSVKPSWGLQMKPEDLKPPSSRSQSRPPAHGKELEAFRLSNPGLSHIRKHRYLKQRQWAGVSNFGNYCRARAEEAFFFKSESKHSSRVAVNYSSSSSSSSFSSSPHPPLPPPLSSPFLLPTFEIRPPPCPPFQPCQNLSPKPLPPI